MWMAGYATRNKPAEGTMHDLWAKAAAFQDASGKRWVCVSTDLLGIPRDLEIAVCTAAEKRFGLPRAAILLNSSHTHSAPVLQGALQDIYVLDEQEKQKIADYSTWLCQELLDLISRALGDMKEAQVAIGKGYVRFGVNRRNNKEADLVDLPALNGPSDYSVPLIRVTDRKGNLMALLFSYACHATVLDGYQWSGDYVGFAQLELEKKYAGCQAMFLQGAGADQNPLPRKSIGRAQQYGKELAAAVEQVLDDRLCQPLKPKVSLAFEEIALPLEVKDQRYYAEISSSATQPFYAKTWAKRMLQRLQNGEVLEQHYPYPIQCIVLDQQLIFALGGELTVQYALDLKKIFGRETVVFGYSNDVMAYIPSEVILKEGGYEGESSQLVYGRPAKWQVGIEKRIIDACVQLQHQLEKR
ncbi:neutral/alkaline non-lysosomal ceramidase N-terminal domain-containing protein [Olivibacter ginsenosidimutans]|uniref:Neutral/alkaline non-lysosomal ceramidase N-terminal domain-containing protein n=2 Tax=Olivibacter ginsenosidimutans TaxID=1176537 RepID=A0ABP9AUJ2_9SPHI